MTARNARRRDAQQWILDYALRQSGDVQNFEHEDRRYPEGVKNYRYVRQGGGGPYDSPFPEDYPWRW